MNFDADVFDEKGSVNKNKRNRLIIVIGLLILIAAAGAVFIFVLGITKVQGISMEPNFHDKQTVLYLRHSSLERGDVVGIKMTNGDAYIKRIIGLPGDEIDIKDGKVYLNGELLQEDYIQGSTYLPADNKISYPFTVEEGTYFVMGDNREHSDDSRTFGPVAKRQIEGEIITNP